MRVPHPSILGPASRPIRPARSCNQSPSRLPGRPPADSIGVRWPDRIEYLPSRLDAAGQSSAVPGRVSRVRHRVGSPTPAGTSGFLDTVVRHRTSVAGRGAAGSAGGASGDSRLSSAPAQDGLPNKRMLTQRPSWGEREGILRPWRQSVGIGPVRSVGGNLPTTYTIAPAHRTGIESSASVPNAGAGHGVPWGHRYIEGPIQSE